MHTFVVYTCSYAQFRFVVPALSCVFSVTNGSQIFLEDVNQQPFVVVHFKKLYICQLIIGPQRALFIACFKWFKNMGGSHAWRYLCEGSTSSPLFRKWECIQKNVPPNQAPLICGGRNVIKSPLSWLAMRPAILCLRSGRWMPQNIRAR